MIVESATALAWLKAGAAVAAGAAIKEATKDAYAALKAKLIGLVGSTAADAVERLEKDPTDAEASKELETDLGKLDASNRDELAGALAALAKAFEADESARTAAYDRGRVAFDLDAKGHITLARIKGVSTFDVKARSRDGDITISDINMGEDPTPGN